MKQGSMGCIITAIMEIYNKASMKARYTEMNLSWKCTYSTKQVLYILQVKVAYESLSSFKCPVSLTQRGGMSSYTTAYSEDFETDRDPELRESGHRTANIEEGPFCGRRALKNPWALYRRNKIGSKYSYINVDNYGTVCIQSQLVFFLIIQHVQKAFKRL